MLAYPVSPELSLLLFAGTPTLIVALVLAGYYSNARRACRVIERLIDSGQVDQRTLKWVFNDKDHRAVDSFALDYFYMEGVEAMSGEHWFIEKKKRHVGITLVGPVPRELALLLQSDARKVLKLLAKRLRVPPCDGSELPENIRSAVHRIEGITSTPERSARSPLRAAAEFARSARRHGLELFDHDGALGCRRCA